MTQDLLEKLADALAKENDGAHVAPEMTRTRVMRRLGEQRRKRRLRLVVIAPLLGLGIGSTALAASSPEFRTALSSIPDFFRSHAGTQSRPIKPHPTKSEPRSEGPIEVSLLTTETVERRLPVSAPAIEPKSNSEPSSRKPASVTSQGKALGRTGSTPDHGADERRPPEVPSPRPASALDLDLDLYRRAHEAQFRSGDYRAALTGYRSYLREHAAGPLAAEASYNAALCEVHLGQNDAARHSLTPFARGAYGSYRQEEARALLEALPAPTFSP